MAKPRVLFVSRTRYRLPLNPTLQRKWDALGIELDLKVFATSADGPRRSEPFVLVAPAGRIGSGLFWLLLPFRVARLLRDFRPDAVVTQSPYEAAAVLLARRLSGSQARVIADVHGDWHTATRLYGSRLRGVASPLADAVADGSLRRVDAVRTVSPYTTRIVRAIGVEPAASFPALIDLEAFSERAPVEPAAEPVALFVGVLEPYKNIDGLAAAWRLAVSRLPGAQLHIVGKGTREDVVESLLRDCPASVRWTRELDADGVAGALDDSTLLVLPSRSEGMGRVVIEAACRARPTIGSRVGGIPDLVEDGVTGMLVEPGDTAALADALVALLEDRARAARLGRAAFERSGPWRQTPQEFAVQTRELVEQPAPGGTG